MCKWIHEPLSLTGPITRCVMEEKNVFIDFHHNPKQKKWEWRLIYPKHIANHFHIRVGTVDEQYQSAFDEGFTKLMTFVARQIVKRTLNLA